MQRKSDIILVHARVLFLERGYDGTTLDDVAAASGVAKTTVYNNFSDKQKLFSAVIDSINDRSAEITATVAGMLNSSEPIETRLHRFGAAVLAGVLQPSVVQLRRLAISEALRFPELIARYWEVGPLRTIEILTDALRQSAYRGEVTVDDPEAAATGLAYALVGPMQDRALLLPRAEITAPEVERHVASVISAFVRGHRRGESD